MTEVGEAMAKDDADAVKRWMKSGDLVKIEGIHAFQCTLERVRHFYYFYYADSAQTHITKKTATAYFLTANAFGKQKILRSETSAAQDVQNFADHRILTRCRCW